MCRGQSNENHQTQVTTNKRGEKLNEITLDQEEKLNLIIQLLAPHCNDDSEHEDLRKIGQAMKNGHALQGKLLSGGYTNHSYKLECHNTFLFAKVAFPYPNWSQDWQKPFDLNRQNAEFQAMVEFSEKMGGHGKAPVATPYLMLDDVPDIRILIAQWAPADEQWGNQFIEGSVDRRVLKRAAEALATIQLSDFDPNFNREFKNDFQKMLVDFFDEKIDSIFEQEDPKDEFATYMQQEVGRAKADALLEADKAMFQRAECLAHGDAHVFNCLVEPKPNVDNLEEFGEKGCFFLCDWEFARPSIRGHDVGQLFAVPLMCAYFHAAMGNFKKALHILECLKELWKHFANVLVEEGKKDEQYLADTFRGCLGHLGSFCMMAFYMTGLFTEHIDRDYLSQEEIQTVKCKLGITGVQFMEVGFCGSDPPASLETLVDGFEKTVRSNIETLASSSGNTNGILRRRSSLLRASGRRVSDAAVRVEMVRRLSTMSLEEEVANEQ